jgi:hypothetical protein
MKRFGKDRSDVLKHEEKASIRIWHGQLFFGAGICAAKIPLALWYDFGYAFPEKERHPFSDSGRLLAENNRNHLCKSLKIKAL